MKQLVWVFLASVLGIGTAFGGDKNGTFARDFQDVSRFEMDSLFIPATVTAGSGSVLSVEAFDVPDGVRVKLSQSGGTVRLVVEKDLLAAMFASRARLVITVPAAADCDLGSASGSIAARGLSGTIARFRSASGSIECSAIAAPIDVDTASGSVEIKGSNFGKVVKTASGSVTIRDSSGDAIIRTASGSVRLKDIEGILKINAVSGSVKIDFFSGRLNVDSTSGSISGKSLRLTGNSVFKTVSGSVDLDLTNEEGDFSYEATSVSGAISLFTSTLRGSLKKGSGPISLTLETVSGSVTVR